MKEYDFLKQVMPDDYERVDNYFERLKLFFLENGELMKKLVEKPKDVDSGEKPYMPQDMWEVNAAIQMIEEKGLEEICLGFEHMKNSYELFKEIETLRNEGHKVSVILLKHRVKIGKSLLCDFTQILETYRLHAEENPGNAKVQNDLKELEMNYELFKNALLYDELRLKAFTDMTSN
jgi:hypothetical protein